jgi:D-amino-acid oxidase
VSGGCDVVVVGAGVSGLTTAICLAEAGLATLVVTERPPRDTTSAVAGAIWGPHLVEPGERTARWGRQTLAVLRELAADPATGVRTGTGVEASRSPQPAIPPPWLAELGWYRYCRPADLPAGFASGWRYAAPLVYMPAYLDYLATRFAGAGGRLRSATVTSLAQLAREHRAAAVVNCTGAAAARLAGDPEMVPVRGEMLVAVNPGLEEFFIVNADESRELMYAFPHGDIVVLGGTEVRGSWSLAPDPAKAERILSDWAAVEPRLRGVRVIGHRVGLRPCRPRVRLTTEPAGGGPVIVHNYGHGGAGVTLSWGCAREVTALITSPAASRRPVG